MSNTTPHLRLTLDGARKILDTAVTKANEMNLPQCIAIVGRIGVGSHTGEQDLEVANAGLAAVCDPRASD